MRGFANPISDLLAEDRVIGMSGPVVRLGSARDPLEVRPGSARGPQDAPLDGVAQPRRDQGV